MSINGITPGAGPGLAALGQIQTPVTPKAASQEPAANSKTPPNNSSQEVSAAPKDRAILAVDNNHKVVIQLLDSNGKVIMQIPPEQSQMIQKELQNAMNTLFSRRA